MRIRRTHLSEDWSWRANYDGEMFTDLTAAARQIGIYPPGDVAGLFGWEGQSVIGKDGIVAPMGAVIALDVTWRGEEPLVRSQVLHIASAISATANGTAYQHGSVSATQKVVAVARLLAAPGGSGSNDLDIIIESDSQEEFAGSKETQLTFTTINQASVALFEKKEANGSITDDWWRAVMTISGGGSRTFSIIVVMGILPQ